MKTVRLWGGSLRDVRKKVYRRVYRSHRFWGNMSTYPIGATRRGRTLIIGHVYRGHRRPIGPYFIIRTPEAPRVAGLQLRPKPLINYCDLPLRTACTKQAEGGHPLYPAQGKSGKKPFPAMAESEVLVPMAA